MMKSSKVSAKLSWSEIPILPDVAELAVAGNISGGTTRNMEALKEIVQLEDGISNIDFTILADAQTSGGLLISVPEERSTALIKSLVDNQSLYSSVVGKVIEGDPGAITVQK
jgi:selenide,water dikinase